MERDSEELEISPRVGQPSIQVRTESESEGGDPRLLAGPLSAGRVMQDRHKTARRSLLSLESEAQSRTDDVSPRRWEADRGSRTLALLCDDRLAQAAATATQNTALCHIGRGLLCKVASWGFRTRGSCSTPSMRLQLRSTSTGQQQSEAVQPALADSSRRISSAPKRKLLGGKEACLRTGGKCRGESHPLPAADRREGVHDS